MRIIKFDQGGLTYLPTVNRSNISDSTSTKATKTEDGKTALKKAMMDAREYGLTNDVAALEDQYALVMNTIESNPNNTQLINNMMSQFRRRANEVRLNYDEYKLATSQLTKEGAWGEVAISANGDIYTQDLESGKIDTVSTKKYIQNKDKYRVLTFDDLRNLRQNSGDMIYNTSVINDMKAASGMKSLVESLESRISKFKETSITGFAAQVGGKVASGMQHIVSGDITSKDFLGTLTAGADGIYKVSQKSTLADTGTKEALAYLYSTLSNNEKNLLNAKAAVEGYDPQAFLGVMLFADTERSLTSDYDTNMSKLYLRGSDSGSEDEEKLDAQDTLAIRTSTLNGLMRQDFIISPRQMQIKDAAKMTVPAWNAGRPQTKDGKPVEQNNLQVVLNAATQFSDTSDFQSITFANQKLNYEDLSKFIWDGESNVKTVILPKINEGGYVRPDFSLVQKVNEINNNIANDPTMTDMQIRDEYAKLQSQGVIYDAEHRMFIYDESKLGEFVTISAIGNEEAFIPDDASIPYIQELDKDFGKTIGKAFQAFTRFDKLDPTKNNTQTHDNPKLKRHLLGIGNDFKQFYRGHIYVAITDPLQSVNSTKNQYGPKSDYSHWYEQYILVQQEQQRNKMNTRQTNF